MSGHNVMLYKFRFKFHSSNVKLQIEIFFVLVLIMSNKDSFTTIPTLISYCMKSYAVFQELDI